LGEILAPTLLIVGEYDGTVLALNQKALAQLKKGCLITIPGATHLFEEAGALDSVSDQAKQWFIAHFPPNAQIR
jgi:putative phosphoribosyl transferase